MYVGIFAVGSGAVLESTHTHTHTHTHTYACVCVYIYIIYIYICIYIYNIYIYIIDIYMNVTLRSDILIFCMQLLYLLYMCVYVCVYSQYLNAFYIWYITAFSRSLCIYIKYIIHIVYIIYVIYIIKSRHFRLWRGVGRRKKSERDRTKRANKTSSTRRTSTRRAVRYSIHTVYIWRESARALHESNHSY
jgi:hypothetical protein